MPGWVLFSILLLYENPVLISASGDSTIKESVSASVRDVQGLQLLVQEILLKTFESGKCILILADSMYRPLFQGPWFRRYKGSASFIMIHTDDAEDLLAPCKATQASLDLARNNSCQLYIILVANGHQVGRLLKFGDRYRLLNTRANYLMLFDSRLFSEELLFLWKRIINVVFIRQFSGKAQNDWFELSTVPFPIAFRDVLAPRRLDVWNRSQFRKGSVLFKDKTWDLKNETLRVAVFAHVPGTLKANTSSLRTIDIGPAFAGSEIEILITIAKQMNFRCELYEPEGGGVELWGRKHVRPTYTGLLSEMSTSRADIALGDLYYIPFVLGIMDLSIPYNTECLTFLTPEALTDISWKTLLLPFSPIMWACVLLCLLLTSTTFYILARFHRGIDGKKQLTSNRAIKLQLHNAPEDLKYSLLMRQYTRTKQAGEPEGLFQFAETGNSLLYTFSMLLLVSLPKLPTGWSLRLLTGWYWLYCLLVVVSYRASMTAILSRPAPKVTIDSLPELLASHLTLGGWGEINSEFFKSSSDDLINTIRERFEIVNSSDEALNRVIEGHLAFYENAYFLKHIVWLHRGKTAKNSNSLRHLHIMRDCIINMPVSIGLQKNSPIKPRVDQLLRRMLEAGLVKKWLYDVMKGAVIPDSDTDGTKALMNLKKMYGALVALAIGYGAGLLALLGELLHFNFTVKKNWGLTSLIRMGR
ncbi:hypothetical protein HUJ04_009368 [Dendroctonus ponderosae]|uniref:Ionotropic glutamate receptor C-terminal domain-containing protein n=2 Tax=Dendroctonus ponderosae TaxID=77166 RepID=A0AAR5PB40_DENPD|nr:hypothetical protein HUJ04_009368 [Dendroctonus ponderosae]